MIWQEIRVNDIYGDFLPNFKSLAHFVDHTMTEYKHLHVLDFANAFITEPKEEHISFFCKTVPKLRSSLIELKHP